MGNGRGALRAMLIEEEEVRGENPHTFEDDMAHRSLCMRRLDEAAAAPLSGDDDTEVRAAAITSIAARLSKPSYR